MPKIIYKGYLFKRSNRPFRHQPLDTFIDDKPEAFPELPTMRGILSAHPDPVDEKEIHTTSTLISQPIHSRLVLPLEGSSLSSRKKSGRYHLQQGLDAAASFFGLSLGASPQQRLNSSQSAIDHLHLQQAPLSGLRRHPSAAIPIRASSKDDSFDSMNSSFHESVDRQHQGPGFDPSDSAPSDYVDKEDGHIWRAKYCVLDGGILYFYRNMTDGESVDALRERSDDNSSRNTSHQGASQVHSTAMVLPESAIASISDLSKSPMPRNTVHIAGLNESWDSSSWIWEKRVVLDCVGAVRSAELEYGPNSFELQGIVNDEDPESPTDTLILRARDQASMKEWIFQFHRSLASFVRDIMDVFGSTGTYLDIDCSNDYTPYSVHRSADDGQRLQRLLSRSPRTSNSPHNFNSLSHGHGRITIHRRRDRLSRRMSSDEIETFPSEIHGDGATGDREPFCSTPGNMQVAHRTAAQMSLPGRAGAKEERPPEAGSEVEGEKGVAALQSYISPSLRGKQALESSGGLTTTAPIRGRYVPPQLRHRPQGNRESFQTLEEREKAANQISTPIPQDRVSLPSSHNLDSLQSDEYSDTPFQLGGCADPRLVTSSIMDAANIPRNASIVTQSRAEPFGSSKFGREVGAVSERGIRDSNEDAYLIANDLMEAFTSPSLMSENASVLGISLFAIFDGHCGNQAARYAAEMLTSFLEEQLDFKKRLDGGNISTTLHDALINLDDTFCRICHEDGREWESGTTALVAVLMGKSLTVASMGDCRGIICRVADNRTSLGAGWNVLDDAGRTASGEDAGLGDGESCLWKEVAAVHKPSDENERKRIESANGWITTETEIPIGQLRRIDFEDEDVFGILSRCFNDGYDSAGRVRECRSAPQRILSISRVCGELAVSRAIGDRDFKAAFHQTMERPLPARSAEWDCPLQLSYPDDHSHVFKGNLIDNSPDVIQIDLSDTDSSEFLLFASDGLWVGQKVAVCFD